MTPSQTGSRNNDEEEVLDVPQSSRPGDFPPDAVKCHIQDTKFDVKGLTSLQGMQQSAYSRPRCVDVRMWRGPY